MHEHKVHDWDSHTKAPEKHRQLFYTMSFRNIKTFLTAYLSNS